MDNEKKREIIIEFESVRVTCRRRNYSTIWCASCNLESEFVGVSEAAAFAGQTDLNVFRRAAEGALHSLTDADGALLICLNSLLYPQ